MPPASVTKFATADCCPGSTVTMYRPRPSGIELLAVAEGTAVGLADELVVGLALGEALAVAVGSARGSAAAEVAQKDAATTVNDTRAAEMPFATPCLMPLPMPTG